MPVSRRRKTLILVAAADVVLYVAATFTAPADAPTGDDPTSTVSSVLAALFWIGVLVLIVLVVVAVVRPLRRYTGH